MDDAKKYEVAIIGGGLAGLGLAIGLCKKGYSVVLFEKERYPFHKVCGEYISLESLEHLEYLGLPIKEMDLPIIKKLVVSAPSGNLLTASLPLGGFGISRYYLDDTLRKIAIAQGVVIFEGCKVEDVRFDGENFYLTTRCGNFASSICCGSFGKRSNIDHTLKRNFIRKKNTKPGNYIGVKYHVKMNHPADTIALHNFANGYCGISKIEDNKYCLCYLTTAEQLKKNRNSIADLERKVLFTNPHLQKIFTESEFLFDQPVTISQISFSKKSQVEAHILLLGDAAGMITPLCGNGMSMALHSGKIAGSFIDQFLQQEITRSEMELLYVKKWRSTFSKRLMAGRMIQNGFGKNAVTNILIAGLKQFPFLTKWIIRNTHGHPF